MISLPFGLFITLLLLVVALSLIVVIQAIKIRDCTKELRDFALTAEEATKMMKDMNRLRGINQASGEFHV